MLRKSRKRNFTMSTKTQQQEENGWIDRQSKAAKDPSLCKYLQANFAQPVLSSQSKREMRGAAEGQ